MLLRGITEHECGVSDAHMHHLEQLYHHTTTCKGTCFFYS